MYEIKPFHGSTVLLFLGSDLVVMRRDRKPWIEWPGRLDLPGGRSEPDESPVDCAIREVREEVGLEIRPRDLRLVHRRRLGRGDTWFYAVHLPRGRVHEVRLGDEGTGWMLMDPRRYCAARDSILHFRRIIRGYQRARGIGPRA